MWGLWREWCRWYSALHLHLVEHRGWTFLIKFQPIQISKFPLPTPKSNEETAETLVRQ
jgi:hypothetical protein